jgi:hypothetical protein
VCVGGWLGQPINDGRLSNAQSFKKYDPQKDDNINDITGEPAKATCAFKIMLFLRALRFAFTAVVSPAAAAAAGGE